MRARPEVARVLRQVDRSFEEFRILVHVAAVAAYLRTSGALPCNVKFLIEGEEEIGSGNLGRFFGRYASLMSADAVVLSDTFPGVRLAGERGYSIYETVWTRPSLSVIALEAQPIHGSSNQIVDSARARLSLRTVPSMDADEAGALLVRKLTTKPPYGARVRARVVRTAPWWKTDPDGPGFASARRALAAGFGREAALIGAGGSIGFVQPFSDLLRGAPCLLTGVEDPDCGAHSENESLHLGDWRKCMRAAVFLYDELSRDLRASA